jgi:hypothetical protein
MTLCNSLPYLRIIGSFILKCFTGCILLSIQNCSCIHSADFCDKRILSIKNSFYLFDFLFSIFFNVSSRKKFWSAKKGGPDPLERHPLDPPLYLSCYGYRLLSLSTSFSLYVLYMYWILVCIVKESKLIKWSVLFKCLKISQNTSLPRGILDELTNLTTYILNIFVHIAHVLTAVTTEYCVVLIKLSLSFRYLHYNQITTIPGALADPARWIEGL